MGQRGGKAAAAKLTPEERRAMASKGGSASWANITKEQRRERALRGKATREAREAGIKAGARLAENFVNALPIAPIHSDGLTISFPTGTFVAEETYRFVPDGGGLPPKKRGEPKAGSNNARVLETLRTLAPMGPGTTVQIARETGLDRESTINALSSLRSGGHIESVELKGSKREKLWRVK